MHNFWLQIWGLFTRKEPHKEARKEKKKKRLGSCNTKSKYTDVNKQVTGIHLLINLKQ